MEQHVELYSITPNIEFSIAKTARVSNPKNENNNEYEKLFRYCIKHGHWSIFEMGHMCVKIVTARFISHQIVRHKSFSFQEYSLRYAEGIDYISFKARRQDNKNRQNSIDDMDDSIKEWFKQKQETLFKLAYKNYTKALQLGIAKEQARVLLPLNTMTTLYMSGNIRSWIHYLQLRDGNGTQQEHQEIAMMIKKIFIKEMPIISKAVEFIEGKRR